MGVLGAVAFVTYEPPKNPDPNHTHADFAVWMDGKQLDFSGGEFMSSPPAEVAGVPFLDVASAHGDEEDGHTVPGREYLHLHEGNGHVIHKHKPGLTIGDFFISIGAKMIKGPIVERGETLDTDCFEWTMASEMNTRCSGELGRTLRMFVNNQEVDFDPDYAFQDLDQILIIHALNDEEVQVALRQLTNDACLYSKTCPWRGEAPAESCLADPAVPCVIPE